MPQGAYRTMKAMSVRAKSVAGVIAALVLLGTAACGQAATPTPTTAPTPTTVPSIFPLSLTDGHGNGLTLVEAPERSVAIDSAAVEGLFLLGEGNRVVGTHDFVSFPPEADGVPRIGSAFSLDFERIAALEPDLVLIFFDQFVPELEGLGVQVLFLPSPGDLDGVAQGIRTLGQIVDYPEEGEKLAKEFEDAVQAARQAVAGARKPLRVYYDASPGWWTAGRGSLPDEIFTLLGARNIFDDIDGFQQVSVEEIVARDPQVAISVFAEGPGLIRSEPALADIAAVRDDRLTLVDGDLLSITGPRLAQGIDEIGKALYPELFP